MKRYIKASNRNREASNLGLSRMTYNALDDMMCEIFDNYNYSENVSQDYIVDVWMEHVESCYLSDEDYRDDFPNEYSELSSITDDQLRSIGQALYTNYDWEGQYN